MSGLLLWAVLVGGSVALLQARTSLVPGSLAVAVAVRGGFMTTEQGQDAITPSILARTRELAWGVELLTGSIGSAAAAGYLIGWLVQGGTPR